MGDSDERLLGDLKRDAKKRAVWILAIVGMVLLVAGAGLVALGWTYEEPHERLATKSVPPGAEIALIVLGAVVAIVGVGLLFRSLRAASRKSV